MAYPFEVDFDTLRSNIDVYVDQVFGGLQSDFLVMPKGPGFVDYPVFENGYEALKQATNGFRVLTTRAIEPVVYRKPISLVVLRSILGFTPSEWAYVASERTEIEITQGAVRSLDRRIRLAPDAPLTKADGITSTRITALIDSACQLLSLAPNAPDAMLHRLAKADTAEGGKSIPPLAELGVPYAMLLYERFLGRPFAAHRDSVSELVGNVLEAAIEAELHRAGISFRKTKRAQKVAGFDQAPDFIIPDEFHPSVVIEAKITEDDGTARDKITRIQHLAMLSRAGQREGDKPRFEIVACIAGRGFRVRREDMRKLLLATRGKVFTMAHLNRLVDSTELRQFRSTKKQNARKRSDRTK